MASRATSSIEYGIKYSGIDRVYAHADKASAQAALDRSKKFPVTKGAKIMQREVYVTDWVEADAETK